MSTLQQIDAPCVPPKGTKGNGKTPSGRCAGMYHSKGWQKAEPVLKALLLPYAPQEPHQGPLCVDVEWTYPYLARTRKRDLGLLIPCDTAPDRDNLQKGLFDVMEKLGYWENDSRVAQGIFNKWWGPNPGIKITIRKATGVRLMSKEEYLLREKGVGV